MAVNSNSYTSQYGTRAELDGQKLTVLALPIISATVNTNAIDLEAASPYPSYENVDFVGVFQAANANSGNNATLTVIMQHSATNVSANFVNVPGQAAQTINSVNAFYPATTLTFGVANQLLQFVRLQVAQGAGGVNSANNANVTFQLGF